MKHMFVKQFSCEMLRSSCFKSQSSFITSHKNVKLQCCDIFKTLQLRTDLAGVIEQLVLKLLDAQDLLKHLVQLVLAEDKLRGGAGCHSLLVLPGVLFASVDGVKFGHPGAQHCFFAQAINLRQAAHPLLYVLLKNLSRVTG